jgi:hypothetical protein
MSDRWFRLYESVVHDPKLQRLPGDVFKGLVNIWCLTSSAGGTLPDPKDIAFHLHMKPSKVQSLITRLRSAGLLDETKNGLVPHNWNGRQFKTDVSTERVRRFRERRETVSGNAVKPFHETPPDTEQNRAEQKQRKERSSLRSDAKKATRLSADWQPSTEYLDYARSQGMPQGVIDREAENFRDYWVAKAGKDGAKLDWLATWRTWVRRTCQRAGYKPPASQANGQHGPSPPKDEHDAEMRLFVGRDNRKWPTPKWGAMPNRPGCLIPPHLIKPDDGKDWEEWGSS